ncbi:helix-turn-helix transcriptional regulator [Parvularcula sp. LCG005]|uniref:helix-turn-helix domain-containing protein n=1 Tax=Parvularcula sp. LCG005 TaxID=3078805 RepID=UPI00294337C8|nr:helix-turn-helix transcriptional regulator [Parvularcula sp. LCG005]WOI52974.1 helix-turn-helix transcriptional regulator [Parvularcula sp. LCG005]
MARIEQRTYSRQTREALALLGKLIRTSRKERRLTAEELSERAGISRSTLQRIEKGHPKVEIGTVFECAAIVGVSLFNTEPGRLSERLAQTEDKLALLPTYTRKRTKAAKDDF